MKKLFLLFICACCACGPEDATPTVPTTDDIDTKDYTLLTTGMLTGQGGHTASGQASVYSKDGMHVLVFEPFASENGPDLKVYLSQDAAASRYIRLGDLKSTMGRQVYEIPSGTDLAQYPFAHVWCEKFTVEFARAELKP